MSDALAFVATLWPAAGLLLDSWHWHHSGATSQDIVDAGAQVSHVQLADAANLAPEDVHDSQRLLPGQGVVDLAGFVAALRTIDYRGLVTPEVFGYQGVADDPISSARAALHATRQCSSTTGRCRASGDGVSVPS